MLRMRLARGGLWGGRFDSHDPHKSLNALSEGQPAFATTRERKHPAAVERVLQVKFVDPVHQGQLLRIGRDGRVREPRTRARAEARTADEARAPTSLSRPSHAAILSKTPEPP